MTIWSEKKVRLKDLKDFGQNPRCIKDKEFKDLVRSLKEDGYHQRFLVNTDLTIIGGHQRKQALLEIGISPDEDISVLMPDRLLSLDEVKRLNIRDNLPYGQFDFDALANNFEVNDLIDWGFAEELLINEEEENIDIEEINTDSDKKKNNTVKCPNCSCVFNPDALEPSKGIAIDENAS